MPLVELVGELQVVVEADNVERVGEALLIVAVHRCRDHARRIELVAATHHRGRYFAPTPPGALQVHSSLPMDQRMMDGELR